MKTILKRRQFLLVIATSAIVLLTLLAAGLSDIQFAPGKPQHFGQSEVSPQQILVETTNSFSTTPLWQQVALAVIFLFIVVLSIIFMPPEMRKRLLYTLLRMVFFTFAILYFFNNYQLGIELPSIEPEAFVISPAGNDETIVVETQVFEPQEIAPIWSYLLSLLILGAFGILAWWLWNTWLRPLRQEPIQIKKLARIAKTSLDDLADGAEWEDVIIRSYVQMGEVVTQRRGLERDKEMTPHEFAIRLVEAGLPPAPVERLTRLFEFVRYSPHKAGEEQMAEAVGCLNQIASAFGEKL